MNIIECFEDQNLFAPLFGDLDLWATWIVCLKAIFALPMDTQELEVFKRYTGRQRPPSKPVQEAYLICGRGAGKSRVASLVVTFLSCFREYQSLAVGEKGIAMVLSPDRRQSRVVFNYTKGLFDGITMLASLVDRVTAEEIHLKTNIALEIHTASFRTLRGYSCICAVADEIAFWRSEESLNPDIEIVTALRPALARVPGSLFLALSSPYARRGVLWNQYKKFWGVDSDRVLVWQADSLSMNPSLAPEVIKQAYEEDKARASAEWGGLFRRDIESFIDREALEACVVTDRKELSYLSSYSYSSFCDPSGGSGEDSMTLSIGHIEDQRAVLDVVREVKPPFSPEAVIMEFAETLKAYHISTVRGDRYGGEWPRERFRVHGIEYQISEKTKSEIYQAFLPMLNSKKVDLLDHPKLIAQTCSLERRSGRSGRDNIDHGPGEHDDLCNAVAGLFVVSIRQKPEAISQQISLGITVSDPECGLDAKPFKNQIPEDLAWIDKYR